MSSLSLFPAEDAFAGKGPALERSAELSLCGLYRFKLGRAWGPPSRPAVFCMLNPSTADAFADDPTIKKCIGFATRWGLAGITVVNLFAWRATDPKSLKLELSRGVDVVGRYNDKQILEACRGAARVVVAWGAHGALAGRDKAVAHLLAGAGVELWCLGETTGGLPRHPLMLPYSTPLVRFAVPTKPRELSPAQVELEAICGRLGIQVERRDPLRFEGREPTWDGHRVLVPSWQDAAWLAHEIAHWLVAAPEHKPLPNFGFRGDPHDPVWVNVSGRQAPEEEHAALWLGIAIGLRCGLTYQEQRDALSIMPVEIDRVGEAVVWLSGVGLLAVDPDGRTPLGSWRASDSAMGLAPLQPLEVA